MSENEKDNKDFEFIKEQVIEKKHRKIKKILFPTISTVGFAVLFGVTAAITFVVIEPRLYKFLHIEEDTITPVCFPTESPDNVDDSEDEPDTDVTEYPIPTPVIVEQSIAADINDYLRMNEDIRGVAYDVNRSIVDIASSFSVKDWFGEADKTVSTTGVIIYNNTKDLLILVSLDKVKDAKSIKLVLYDDVTADAVLQDSNSELNLAIIAVAIADIPEIYLNNLQPAALGDSYTVTVGNPIIALGSPNGYSGSMEIGMVTSKGSSVSITDNRLQLFNTSIVDNEDSDGIIVNMIGEIIGVITRTLKEDKNENLNTVIGISELKPILEVMGNQEPHIYFGVKMDDMAISSRKEYDIESGIYVNEVKSDSPAFDAGIQKGDIILEIDDEAITNSYDFNNTITDYQPGDKISVLILRLSGNKEKQITVDVTLGNKSN